MKKFEFKKPKKTLISGYSIMEMLVVLAVFTFLSIVITQSLASSLRGAKKSENQNITKENVDYALSTIERLLRNATDLDCDNTTPDKLIYFDEIGRESYFECNASQYYIASGSAVTFNLSPPFNVRLTSPEVNIMNCNAVFTCNPGSGTPDSVSIRIQGRHVTSQNVEGSQVESSSKVLLRTY